MTEARTEPEPPTDSTVDAANYEDRWIFAENGNPDGWLDVHEDGLIEIEP